MRCNHAETIKPNHGTIGSSLAWPRIAPSAGTSIAMAALNMTCPGAMVIVCRGDASSFECRLPQVHG
jgi:hypothetical protein